MIASPSTIDGYRSLTSPEIYFLFQVFFNEVGVTQVDVPSLTGNFGILPNHVPLLSVLKPGIVTIYTGNGTEKYFVSSGTITVNKDSSAQILAEEAAPLPDLDIHAAKQGLEASQTLLSTASNEEERAKAIIAIEFHEALIKSLEQVSLLFNLPPYA